MKELMDSTDHIEVLIQKAQSGSRIAFDELIERNRDRLVACIQSRMGPHLRGKVELTDVLQETLLRSFNSVRRFQYRGEDSFLRWLCSVSEFVIRDFAKIFGSERAAVLDRDVPGKVVSPSKALRRDERFNRLGRAIEDLSPDYREVVTSVCLKRRSVKETAEYMKRTPGAIRNLLRRALRDLKGSFGDTESLHLPPGTLDRGESGDEDS